MIYVVASIHLKSDMAREFNEVMEKDYVPIVTKYGYKLIACLKTAVGNVDEVTDIWEFESLAHMEKARQARDKDPKYAAARKKLKDLMVEEITKTALPLPVSPLK